MLSEIQKLRVRAGLKPAFAKETGAIVVSDLIETQPKPKEFCGDRTTTGVAGEEWRLTE